MEEKLKEIDILIDESDNLPRNIKGIVKAICKGYMRESGGLIPIKGIENVCKTVFLEQKASDKEFSGEERILGLTDTEYDDECKVFHQMSYLLDENSIKLIAILTHELGHVITEYEPKQIITSTNGIKIYPFIKKTTSILVNCRYTNDGLEAQSIFGYKMSDGFLESICSRIWRQKEFRFELLKLGYDLGDYIYKDERLFPSRIYDEYKACFELINYILDGKLFEFSCIDFEDNEKLHEYIVSNRLNIIFGYLDKSNDALWNLKKYEDSEASDDFKAKFEIYQGYKEISLQLPDILMDIYVKDKTDETYLNLLAEYADSIKKQKHLPIIPISDKYLI